MKVETPSAFRYFFHEDVFLLDKERQLFDGTATLKAPLETAPEPASKPEPVNYRHLGNNLKAFLILVCYPNNEFIPPDHLAALEATLKRKEYTINDVAIVNVHTYADASIEDIKTFFEPEKIMIMGQRTAPKGLTEAPFNKPAQLGGIMVLVTHAFDEMMNSNEHKKAFWEQVKNF